MKMLESVYSGFKDLFRKIGNATFKFGDLVGKEWKTHILPEKTIKKEGGLLKGVFESLKQAHPAIMAAITLLESMSAFVPIFQLLNTLWEYFQAQLLLAMLPTIIQLITILTSPEFLESSSLWAQILAAYLLPNLQAMVAILQIIQPYLPAMNTAFSEALPIIKTIISIVYLLTNTLAWCTIHLKEINKALTEAGERIITFYNTLYGGKGGGKGGKGSGNGGEGILEKVAHAFGYQFGTPYVPQTGIYKLHEGERVTSAMENYATSMQMDNIIMLQQETNEVQKDILKYMKYER